METHPRSVMRGSMLAGFGRGGRRIPGGTASNGLMMTRRLANGDRVSMMTRLVVESALVQPPRQLVVGSMHSDLLVRTCVSGTPWQHDAKDAAVALVALDLDAAAIGFDGPAGDGQAKPGAARLSRAGVVHAIEALEDPLAMRSGNAGSRVAHVDRDAAGLDRKSTRLNSSHLGISYAV